MTQAPGQGTNTAPCRVLVVGNVALDRDGDDWKPGGPALYSALVLARLGASPTVVSNMAPSFPIPSGDITWPTGDGAIPRYANSYDADGDRTQHLLAEGDSIDALPDGEFDAVLVAPAYHELDALLARGALSETNTAVRAFALQGFLRDVDLEGRVVPRRLEEAGLERLPPESRVFFSDEDTADAHGLARSLAEAGHVVFLTRGYLPIELITPTGRSTIDTAPARPVDPTGAGDCFAAAVLVRLCEGVSYDEAGRFGAAAAALMVESEGFERLPTRDAVEARMAKVAVS